MVHRPVGHVCMGQDSVMLTSGSICLLDARLGFIDQWVNMSACMERIVVLH